MINKDNKTTVGVYKGNTEIVKILKNNTVVYYKEYTNPLNTATTDSIYYCDNEGKCHKTFNGIAGDYKGVVFFQASTHPKFVVFIAKSNAVARNKTY